MSTEIDQRVVEMRFDNKHFESNVQTTMSSLDKLKQKLRLDNASKGLEEVNSAAKKVDMTHLGKGLETVQAKFSALQVVGVTALANITNSAVNAGKRIISALTIDPVKTGFQEYETQMNAVQTILANTQSKGSTLKDVNAALDELNTYADKTIYNFTEMTRNIGTFTAAGIDLDTSVNAIQGIANLAAVSGSSSQQASTAMYQLSQALASGTVKLMDWNSVVNAGMGGQVFQDALKETSRLLGTGADAAIKAEGSFRESLTQGWLTAEVLTETLKKFTESGASERVAEYTGLSKEAVDAALESAKAQYGEADAIKYASKALAEKSGKSADEIEKTLKFAQTATDAATKVKTFSQLWDVMKESAQSGWAQTWKLIVGDFEQAKALLTPLADFFTGAINKMSEARNKLLKGALGDRFSKLSKTLDTLLGPAKSAVKVAETATTAMKDLNKIVDQVIIGKFGNGKKRFDALTEAGYNYYEVQNKVNEKLGDSFRYTVKTTDAQKESTKTQEKLGKTEEERLETLANMSEAELKNLGYSKEQIKSLKELKKEADKLGMSVSDFVKNIDELDGRTILINSFKNIGQGLVSVFKALKDAWREVFPPMTSDHLYNIIAGLHKFSTYCVVSDETADKLKRTLKGVFAIVKIVATVVGGPLKLAFKILSQLLGVFDLNILDITAKIGDAIVKFSDWLDSVLDFTKVFEKIKPSIEKAIEAVKEWCKALKESDFVSNAIEGLKKGAAKAWGAASEFAKNIVKGIKDKLAESEFVSDLISGFVNGLKNGAIKVWEAVKEFGQKIIETVCDVLGIESPSKEFMEIGINCILGFLEGIKKMLSPIGEVANTMFDALKESFDGISWDKLTNSLLLIGSLFPAARIFSIGSALTRWFGSIGGDAMAGLLEGLKNGLGGIIEVLKNIASTIVTTVCDVLGIKSPSRVMMTIGAFLISGLIVGMVNSESGLFSELGTICTGLYKFVKENIGKLAEWLSTIELPELNVDTIISAGALIGVIFTVKKLLKIFEQFGKGVSGFGKMCTSAGTFIDNINNKFFPDLDAKKTKMESFATTLLKLSISLAIVAGAAKLLAGISWPDLAKAGVAIAVLGGIMIALTALVRKHGQDIPKISGMLLSLSVSLLLLSGVMGIIGTMEYDTIGRGLFGIGALMTFIGLFVQIVSAHGKDMPKIAGMLMALSTGLLMLTGVMGIIGTMEYDTIGRGLFGIGALMTFIGLFAAIMNKYAKDMPKMSAFLMSLSFGLLLLTGVIALLGNMEVETLVKGGIAVAALMTMIGLFAAMMNKYAKDMPKIAAMLISLSAGLLILTGVIALLGHMSPETLIKGGIAVAALMTMVGLFAIMVSKYGKEVPKISAMMLTLSLAIGILATVCVLLGIISIPALAKGIIAVGLLSAFMAMMIKATRGAKDCQKNIMMMAIAIGVMAAAVAALSFIPLDRLTVATGCLALVMGMFALMTSAAGKAKKAMGTVAIMMVLIAELTGCLYLLSKLPVENVLGAALGLGVVMLAFAGSMEIMGGIKSVSKSVQKTLPVMLGVVAGLGGILAILAMLPIDNAIPAAVGLGILLTAFSTSMVIMGKIKSISKSVQATIPTMLLVVLGLGGILGLLAVLPIQNAMLAATSLSILLLAFSSSMVILGVAGSISKSVQATLPTMLLIAAGLAAILAIMAVLPVTNAIPAAIGLGILLNAMATALLVLSYVGNVSMTAIVSMAALTLVVAGLAVIIGLLAGIEGIENAVPIATALSTFLLAMSGALVLLTIVGLGGPAALIGIASLAALIVALIALVVLIGGLMDKFPILEQFLDKGLQALIKLAGGIGEMIGAFVGGIIEQVGSKLPGLGQNLGLFMTNAMPFITGAKMIDGQVLKGVGILGLALLELTAANIIDGISKFFNGGSSFSRLGTELSMFMANAMPFIVGSRLIDESAMKGIKALAEAILILTASDILDGLTSWLTGGSSLSDFGKELESFAPSIRAYADEVKGIDGEAVKASAEAAKNLAQMAKTMPNSGGLLGKIMGENDAGAFGAQLEAFGVAMKNYSIAVTGLAVEPINVSVEAAKSLIGLAESIPNYGGMVSWFTGENDFATFGNQLVAFGTALRLYSIAVTGLALEPIQASVEAGKSLVGLAEAIPNYGGMVSWFTGDNDFVTFGSQIVAFGMALNMYSLAVAGINVEAIAQSVEAGRSLAGLAAVLPTDGGFWSWFKDDKLDLASFGEKIIPFGAAIKAYSNQVSGINLGAMKGAVSGAKEIVSLIKNIKDLNTSGVNSFVSAINTLGTASVNKFINAFTSAKGKLKNAGSDMMNSVVSGIKSKQGALTSQISALISVMSKSFSGSNAKFNTAGVQLITAFNNGVNSSKSKINSALKSGIDAAVKTVRGYKDDFKSLGKDVVDGFVKGINKNAFKAKIEARAMAKAAYEAAKEAIDSNSPSKKFEELGKFSDQGLAVGLTRYAYLAKAASADLGTDIVTSLQDSLDINSPAKVIKNEVGRYVVQGLAEGIKSDMSAEEQAEKKAQNIVSAFKAELDKQDLAAQTIDLELELFKSKNPKLSKKDTALVDIEALIKKRDEQAKNVQIAEDEYLFTMDTLKDNAKAIEEAKQKWLQEQIDLQKLNNDISDQYQILKDEAIADKEEMMSLYDLEQQLWEAEHKSATDEEKALQNIATIEKKKAQQNQIIHQREQEYLTILNDRNSTNEQIQEAYKNLINAKLEGYDLESQAEDEAQAQLDAYTQAKKTYDEWISANKRSMIEEGLTMDQIKGRAEDAVWLETGIWVNSFDVEKYKKMLAGDKTVSAGESMGASLAAGLDAGLQSSASVVGDSVSTMGDACVSAISNTQTDWFSSGASMAQSFADGIKSNISVVVDAVVGMVTNALTAMGTSMTNLTPGGVTGGSTVNPVTDLSNIQNGLFNPAGLFMNSRSMAMVSAISGASPQYSFQTDGIIDAINENKSENSQIKDLVKELGNEVHQLRGEIDGMRVVLDSGALVGELANEMDSKLGRIATYKGRGN